MKNRDYAQNPPSNHGGGEQTAQACEHGLLSMMEIPFNNQSLLNGIRQSLGPRFQPSLMLGSRFRRGVPPGVCHLPSRLKRYVEIRNGPITTEGASELEFGNVDPQPRFVSPLSLFPFGVFVHAGRPDKLPAGRISASFR
jgi:hypothetical protein